MMVTLKSTLVALALAGVLSSQATAAGLPDSDPVADIGSPAKTGRDGLIAIGDTSKPVTSNGTSMNGRFVQGTALNGRFVQGRFVQGTTLNGRFVQGRSTQGGHQQGGVSSSTKADRRSGDKTPAVFDGSAVTILKVTFPQAR